MVFHAVDEQFITHPFQKRRELGEVIGCGDLADFPVVLGTGADLVKEQLVGIGEIGAETFVPLDD